VTGSTAAFALVFDRFVLDFDDTATGSFSTQSRIDNSSGTADACLHSERFGGTIHCTSPTLHAGIPICDPYMSVVHDEYGMGANHHTHTATRAIFLV
jgi:hypothetical protein